MAHHRPVLVHTCFSATQPISIPRSFGNDPLRCHENPNAVCRCSELVSHARRDALIFNGDAYMIARRNTNGYYFPETREIVLVGKRSKPPAAASVLVRNLERAYGIGGESGNEDERLRIEWYGTFGLVAGEFAWRQDVQEKAKVGVLAA